MGWTYKKVDFITRTLEIKIFNSTCLLFKMLFSNRKYLLILLSILLISFIVNSPFGKGGISQSEQILIIGFIIGISLIFGLKSNKNGFNTIQKLIKTCSIFLSSCIGIVSSYFIVHYILENVYGLDYRLYLNDIITNISFISISFLISITLLSTLNRF